MLAHLLTGSPCNHPMPAFACPVCCHAGASPRLEAVADAEAVRQALVAVRAEGAKAVSLRDGELLARPEALEIIAEARRLGFEAVEVWTSGLALGRPGIAEALAGAGATHVAVAMYGDSAEAHDYITGAPGHFQRVIGALRRSRGAGLRTGVLVPLLRPGLRSLHKVVQKAIPAEVSSFRLIALDGPDRAEHPLLAPLALGGPFLRAAVQMAQAARRRCTVLGVPACLLGDLAAATREPAVIRAAWRPEGAPDTWSGREVAYGRPCEGCTWRSACPGLPAGVAATQGWAGLAARADAPGA